MTKQTKFIKAIYYFVNLMLGFNYFAFGFLILTGVIAVVVPPVRDYVGAALARENFQTSFLSISLAAIAVLFNFVLIVLVLRGIKQFLRNLLNDHIFTEQNVTLARRTSLYLFLMSFYTGDSGIINFSINAHYNDISLFDFSYILAALLVWVISVVLERAVVIAKENEFTI
ncbi:DUF2975 domain-containing protein [Streptococcus dentasini]